MAATAGTQRRASKQATAPLPYRAFLSAAKNDILVGRGSKHNDALTFKVAKGRDLGCTSRHPGLTSFESPTGPTERGMPDAAMLPRGQQGPRGERHRRDDREKHVRSPKERPRACVCRDAISLSALTSAHRSPHQDAPDD